MIGYGFALPTPVRRRRLVCTIVAPKVTSQAAR